MDYWDKKLLRRQLSQKLKPLKQFNEKASAVESWIKTLREALGMTTYDLSKRMGVDQSRIPRIEKAEKDGNIKVSTLQKAAKAFNMKFVYGFVPEDDLEQIVREQAKKIAMERMERLNQTMALEDQDLDKVQEKESLDDLIDKIVMDPPSMFWE